MGMYNQPVLFIGSRKKTNLFSDQCRHVFGSKIIFATVPETRISVQSVEKQILKYKHAITTVVLLLPFGHPAYEQFPAVLQHKSLGLVVYENDSCISNWLESVASYKKTNRKLLITGMQKPFYEKWCRKIYSALKASRTKNTVQLKLPFSIVKEALAKEFAKGFATCIYCGHGRSRGWSGYRGIRWADIGREKNSAVSGLVISLSCSTLKINKQTKPFGLEWVNSKRLCAFLGCKTAVHIQPLIVITGFLIEAFAKKNRSIGAMLIEMDHKIKSCSTAVQEEWKNFILIGNPFQPLG
jgi:hypothetical protein